MNFNKSLDTQNQMQFFIYQFQLGNGISKANYVGKHPKNPRSNPRNKSHSKYSRPLPSKLCKNIQRNYDLQHAYWIKELTL